MMGRCAKRDFSVIDSHLRGYQGPKQRQKFNKLPRVFRLCSRRESEL